jgi:formate hydrogenlyase subunit 3/multisubunit Na+/H+ antiporter MnhD subunit
MNCIAEALALSLPMAGLAILLPLLAAATIGLRLIAGVQGDASEAATAGLARGTALATLLLLLALAVGAFADEAATLQSYGVWFAVPDFSMPLSVASDARTLLLAALVAFVGWVTLVFSTAYLHREPGFHRFFLFMCLFLAGMQLIVLAGNALLAFVGWELCGLASWALIGYADERPVATGNALFVFLANRVGDAAFLLAIGLAFWWVGSIEWSAIAGGALPETVKARMIALGLVTAALAKSAQLPFTPWIARALEGPTPSSAVFYGALMVHAGVILLIRIEPLLLQLPDMMAGLAVAGLATAVYCWLCGRVQTDVKSALVYATVSQIGLMVAACGLGWFDLAAVHLALHALWRAYQFLMAPSYLLLAPRPARLPAALTANVSVYTAVLQGFWLDRLARGLLLRPTLSLGHDVRRFDERVIDRVLGAQEAPVRSVAPPGGVIGRALAALAAFLQRVEDRLVLDQGGGGMARGLKRLGEALRVLEGLLEEPRYLMLMVMATFVVIL